MPVDRVRAGQQASGKAQAPAKVQPTPPAPKADETKPTPPTQAENQPSQAKAPAPDADPSKATPAPMAQTEPGKPVGREPILDSPRDFGIHINGILTRFRKGRTALTVEQAEALEADSYTADNGAEVIWRDR